MRALRLILFIGGALVLQTTIARFAGGSIRVDLVLVTVVYLGLSGGPTSGLIAGTLGGLAQDALAGGVLGIGGLAKTIVGYLAGVVGTQFIVSQPLQRFLVFFGGSLVQSAVIAGLNLVLEIRPGSDIYVVAVAEAVGNALVGMLLFQFVEVGPGLAGRRASRGSGRYARRV